MLLFECASIDFDSGFIQRFLRALRIPLRIGFAIQQVRHEFREGIADDSIQKTHSDLEAIRVPGWKASPAAKCSTPGWRPAPL